jgi:hypothetical protein
MGGGGHVQQGYCSATWDNDSGIATMQRRYRNMGKYCFFHGTEQALAPKKLFPAHVD